MAAWQKGHDDLIIHWRAYGVDFLFVFKGVEIVASCHIRHIFQNSFLSHTEASDMSEVITNMRPAFTG